MHFWIDKRNQGCRYNGRHLVPPSISGYGRNPRILCSSSFYHEPMVTPVHRFQSIESVANNGLRTSRAPIYSPRLSYPQTNHYNGSANNVRSPNGGRSMEMISNGSNQTATRRTHSQTTKFKCGVWIFFAMFFFFFAGVKYYIHGINIGVEALVFCLFLVLVLVVGGFVSLCEAISGCAPTNSPSGENATTNQAPEQTTAEEANAVAQTTTTVSLAEMPPPPYHIAVTLSPHNELETIQVIRDSPPPSYEKAVT